MLVWKTLCKKYTSIFLQFIFYTIIQSGIYNAAAHPTRSIAQIESNCIPPTPQTVLQNPQSASLLLPRIAQVSEGRRVLHIHHVISLPCELHSIIDIFCITCFYKTESREPNVVAEYVKQMHKFIFAIFIITLQY